jgi:hypothetical protein
VGFGPCGPLCHLLDLAYATSSRSRAGSSLISPFVLEPMDPTANAPESDPLALGVLNRLSITCLSRWDCAGHPLRTPPPLRLKRPAAPPFPLSPPARWQPEPIAACRSQHRANGSKLAQDLTDQPHRKPSQSSPHSQHSRSLLAPATLARSIVHGGIDGILANAELANGSMLVQKLSVATFCFSPYSTLSSRAKRFSAEPRDLLSHLLPNSPDSPGT